MFLMSVTTKYQYKIGQICKFMKCIGFGYICETTNKNAYARAQTNISKDSS